MGIGLRHRPSSHLSAPAVVYFGIYLKMNKLILCGAVLLAVALLLPASSAQETSPKKKKSSSAFLDDLCAKCKYCKTDPECSGCAKCSECNSRREKGCRFCKKNEEEKKCIDRCKKGCRICGGDDGTGLESGKKRDQEKK